MRKRTLLFAALLLVSFLFLLLVVCNVDLLRDMPDPSRAVLLSGKLNQIETKQSGRYLYLSHALGENESYGRVILFVSEDLFSQLELKIGNQIEAACKHTGFRTARNFGNFDEQAYYHSLGIAGKFELQKGSVPVITDASYDPIRQWLFETREKITETFQELLSSVPEKAGIFSAIVTGDRSEVDGETKTLYQRNGIAHILAVSGLHISLIGMGIFRILRKLFFAPDFRHLRLVGDAFVLHHERRQCFSHPCDDSVSSQDAGHDPGENV